MAFTFIQDTNGKAGAVKATTNGNDFYIPTREQGSESLKGAVQNVPVAGTRVQLPNYPCREVTIIAKDTNTGLIFAGGNDVTSAVYGVKLKPDASYTFSVSNTNLIWINSSVNGEGISYIAI